MRRSYEYYQKELQLDYKTINSYYSIMMDVLNGKVDDERISLLNNENGMKMCLYENLFSTFKAMLYPSVYLENGENYYRYLLDPISYGIVDFIQNTPNSLSEALARARSSSDKRTDEEILREALVIIPEEKISLLDTIFHLDSKRIRKVKIKDVHARMISGWCHPILREQDVIYYSEISNVYPSIELFKRNILTTYNDTNGCKEDSHVLDTDAQCEIRIDYDSLDEENRIYADTLIQRGYGKIIMESESKRGLSIFTPCNRNETIGVVNDRTMGLLSGFHKQDVLFGVYTYEELVRIINYYLSYVEDSVANEILEIANDGLNSEKLLKIFAILGETGFYYDAKEDKFWKHSSYYDRHIAYLREKGIESNTLEKLYPEEQ